MINGSIMKIIAQWITCNIGNEVGNTLILIDILHGHAILHKKNKTYQSVTRNSSITDFRATFLYNRGCRKSKSRDKKKAAATEQGNFYWERRLCLFWKLNKESITMLLVSLVHQFIWPSFALVFTRNVSFRYSEKPWTRLTLTVTSIFIMSDKTAFRGIFRIEANQTSKVERYTGKIASWTVEGFKLWNIFAQSSIFHAWLRSNSEQTWKFCGRHFNLMLYWSLGKK